ncbi:DUF2796 domain-containing protein [Vibrio tubiashii]|uniref:zinc uptake protein ZrgA n=1 Tax=Vibrio tubiashii TaxID=29498 RepID=UPI001EFE0265|nr:DUF2796 domain-containing protein [Vibrio tubiashii]MCG9577449.1 DUF2796 domain-containing protein [Vibrio tubiashii]
MKNITPIALGITLAVSGIAQACEGGFRQHGAHVHGEVELNIAQDGKELLIEITAPGADVVGFEHAPKTDEQKHQLEDAIAKLNNASSVFTLASSAGCKVVHQSVSHTLGADNHDHDHDHDHHDEHAHDKHKHEDGHDHDSHEGHEGHDHDHDDHKGHDHHDEHKDHDHQEHGGHGEFTVEYHYACDDISTLSNIDTQWFTQFPNTEKLKVNVLTETKQASLELGKGDSKISL